MCLFSWYQFISGHNSASKFNQYLAEYASRENVVPHTPQSWLFYLGVFVKHPYIQGDFLTSPPWICPNLFIKSFKNITLYTYLFHICQKQKNNLTQPFMLDLNLYKARNQKVGWLRQVKKVDLPVWSFPCDFPCVFANKCWKNRQFQLYKVSVRYCWYNRNMIREGLKQTYILSTFCG